MENKPLLVSISLFVPYDGIPHAGGEYVRRHYGTLAEFFDTIIVAPANRENLSAVDLVADRETVCVIWMKPMRDLGQIIVKTIKFVRGVSLGIDLEFSFSRNRELRRLLADAAVVEFQWTESASLLRRIRSLAPSAKTVLVAHDIVSQRWQRESASGGLTRRLFYRGRMYFTKKAERRRFSEVDLLLVFSDKDAQLAKKIAPTCTVRVVDPPLADEEMGNHNISVNPHGRSVLFTGAFARPENHEAAIWLLTSIWPSVVEKIPDANLVLAGAGPFPELERAVEAAHGVTLTGYVHDLAPYYKSGDVFVAPLLHGAGVKFKNITAMLWGLPILTTPVGAEGIGGEEHYLAVTDSTQKFSDVLVEALIDVDLRRSVAIRANNWVQGKYTDTAFRSRLMGLYL